MNNYITTPMHPPHRAALGCADTISQALGSCCSNCAQGRTCKGRGGLGATTTAGSAVFMIGAGLAIWWALSRKPKRRMRRNPGASKKVQRRKAVRKRRLGSGVKRKLSVMTKMDEIADMLSDEWGSGPTADDYKQAARNLTGSDLSSLKRRRGKYGNAARYELMRREMTRRGL